jgi:hypothetical protein
MKRFPALHTISAIFKILSWLVAIIAIVLAGVTIAGVLQTTVFGSLGNIVAAVIILFIGGFYALVLHAVAEIIFVFLAIEENTRKKE